MNYQGQLFAYQDVEKAIDKEPLVINPDMLLLDAIALIGEVKKNINEPIINQDTPSFLSKERHYDYALVIEEGELQGILTERDIVKLTADQLTFSSVYVGDVMTETLVTLAIDKLNDIFSILFLFRRYHIRHLPILDRENKLLGVITPSSIRNIIRPEYLLKMRRINDVMTRKVFHAPKVNTVLDVAKLMTSRQVSCIVITKTEDRDNLLISVPIGIITERDILQYQSLQLDLSSLPAEEVMSTPLFLMNAEDSLLEACLEMERRHTRRLVVSSSGDRGFGIITQTSILRIFDPIEMYRTIGALKDTLKNLEREKAELMARLNLQRG
ncbi:MAG: CBS domain-containing protein [Cyanobacteria bacterium J06600_6]